MKPDRTLRRWLSAAATVMVFALILVLAASPGRLRSGTAPQAEQAKPGTHSWPLFGGTVQRNLVNTFEHNIASDWNVASKQHIRWVAALGSKAYGGPIVAGGKIFVGTNNDRPRNPAVTGDKGIVMCFR